MLTAKQKKFIRKNARKLTLNELARQLDIPPEELKEYLKKIWRENKFTKYTQKSLPLKPISFSPKDWLKNNWYLILGLTLLIFLVYANGLGNAFVSDDINWIPKNPNIGNFSFLFQKQERPAIWFIFYFAHLIGGLNPFFYRLPNVLFHTGNTIAIFFLLSFLFNKRVAVFTSLIFAVHPILVESVTWIAGGSHSAYTFFFLLAFIFYLLAKKKAWLYFFTILFFLISLSFSEKAVVLFLIFPLYEIAFGSLIKKWKSILPYLIAGIFVAVALFNKIGGKIIGLKIYNYVQPGFDNPFYKIPIAITEYLRLMFWPSDLSLYRSELIFTWGEYFVRLGIFIILLLAICISYWRLRGGKVSSALLFWKNSEIPVELYKKERWLFFWLLFFIITLLPVLTPYRFASTVAERYVYLGSIGVFAVIGMILDTLSENEKLKKGVYIIFAILILALSIRTVVRNRDWANEDNLWIASAKVSPHDPNVLNNLGDMYGRHQDYGKAVEAFSLAIKLQPGYADAYHNLANIQTALYLKENKEEYLKLAINNYLLAIKYNPLLWQSHRNLGIIYFNLREFGKAAEELGKAIEINPSNLELQYEAKEIFADILRVDPTNQAASEILKQISLP